MEQAQLPWDPKRHQVWPASFRRAAHTLMRVSRRLARDQTRDMELPHVVWLQILSYCGRGWFPVCDWCQRPSDRLLRCTGCRLVRYCGKACGTAAWETHKKACKAERKRKKKKKAKSEKTVKAL